MVAASSAPEQRDALEVIGRAAGQPRFFLRTANATVVGIGAARVAKRGANDRAPNPAPAKPGRDLHDGMSHAAPEPAALAVGGFAFGGGTRADSPWQAFPASSFVVPQTQIMWQSAGRATVRHNPDSTPPAAAVEPKPTAFAPASRSQWMKTASGVIAAISAGRVQKVVLARQEFHPRVPDPAQIITRLSQREPNANVFLVEPTPGHAFWGASPETLVRLHHGRIETHALAGSAARAVGRGSLLLQSKERDEHEFVAAHIVSRLSAAGATNIVRHKAAVRRMRSIEHIETRIEAGAPRGTHVLDLAAALHPTPAVCGSPVDASLAMLERVEGFDRGWYGGGVGWFEPSGDGEICVALRCGLTTPQGTWLFAGAGLVKGSDPAAEWDETELKMGPMRDALEVAR
jgi:menaquinone-specific isochorismate synthase